MIARGLEDLDYWRIIMIYICTTAVTDDSSCI